MYHARYEKPLKNHSLDVAKKYVETYSPSNAAARNLEDEVQTNPKLHRKNLTKFDNSKPRLTELEWLIFPAKTLRGCLTKIHPLKFA